MDIVGNICMIVFYIGATWFTVDRCIKKRINKFTFAFIIIPLGIFLLSESLLTKIITAQIIHVQIVSILVYLTAKKQNKYNYK